jgi:hypothetical protein
VKPIPTQELARWLAAEAAEDAERAEAALAALVAALPPQAPPAGFAGRVLARAGLAPRRGLLGALWVRLTLGLALAGAGVAAAIAPELLRGLAASLDPAALLATGPRLLAVAAEHLVRCLDLGLKLLEVARVLAAPFTSPSAATASLAALLVAAAALRLLYHLIATDRSWSYVDAHE